LSLNWFNYKFLSYFKNSVALNHISEDHTLLRKSSHTHALHELSWLLKNFYPQGNLYLLITWLFFICLRIFHKLSNYFLRFRYMCVLNSCWSPNLVIFLCFFGCVWLWIFSEYFVYPLSLWDKNGEYFLFLDRKCISKPIKCFLLQNGQRRSLLVFYIGNILVDKNSLCNGFFLTGFSVLFRIFILYGQCLISFHVLVTSF
jgi:hypothetical protein